MEKTTAGVLLLSAGSALAHPGHGMPGWIHPHAADYGLLLLGIAVGAGLGYAAKRLLSRKK